MAAVLEACRAGGMWPFSAGNRIHLAPPLVVAEEELERRIERWGELENLKESFLD